MIGRLKSIFIGIYITAAVGGLVTAVVMMSRAGAVTAWLGTALACAGPVLFFAGAYVLPRARTSPNLHGVLAAGGLGTVLSVALGGSVASPATLLAAAVGILGTLLYVYWYSRFGDGGEAVLQVGAQLPAFAVVEHGRSVPSSELVGTPALWIFYRGNWCPICVAQVREIAGQYRELERRGVAVFLVSPQPEENSTALAAKVDAPMRFLTDRGSAAAAVLGIRETAGLPAGMEVLGYDSDVPRPTVFITAAGGRIIYCERASNYRVRPEPAQFFAVLDRHALA